MAENPVQQKGAPLPRGTHAFDHFGGFCDKFSKPRDSLLFRSRDGFALQPGTMDALLRSVNAKADPRVEEVSERIAARSAVITPMTDEVTQVGGKIIMTPRREP